MCMPSTPKMPEVPPAPPPPVQTTGRIRPGVARKARMRAGGSSAGSSVSSLRIPLPSMGQSGANVPY